MKLVVGISGASGAIYGVRVLEELRKKGVETHLIISKWGRVTIERETSYSAEGVKALASFCYEEDEMTAPISSGSFRCDGMIVSPCSMKTLAGIAHGLGEDLLTRAADVNIKEQRKLVLMVRETPFSPIHLGNMLKLSRIGVVILPPVPAFYTAPETLDDIINQAVGKALEQFGIDTDFYKRWDP